MLIYMLLETLQHSDHNAHIYSSIKIGDEIFVREKEFSKGQRAPFGECGTICWRWVVESVEDGQRTYELDY